jgi:HEAT repeat protein
LHGAVSPEERWVLCLASKSERREAMRQLLGAVNARDLRNVRVSAAALGALLAGLRHPNPQVRFWSLQLLDHCPEPQALDAIAPLLDDRVPRVRRNAAHALGCHTCKPAWSGQLDDETVDKLTSMANGDPSSKVRAEARNALRGRGGPADPTAG